MWFFRKFCPAISMKIVYGYIVIRSIIHFFTATIWGFLTLSAVTYAVLWFTNDVKPFAPSQLLLWMIDLPDDYKIAISSSVLTVIGFLVAFHTATMNWKQQMNAQLRIEVADEIEGFFNEVLGLISNTKIYANLIIKTVNKVQNQKLTPETAFSIRYVLDKTPNFRSIRDRLVELSVKVYRIAGKNANILATSWNATSNLNDVNKEFSKVIDAIWVHVPYILDDDPNPLKTFLSQVNVDEYHNLISCCEKSHTFISGTTGGIRGELVSPIIGFNLPTIKTFISQRGHFRQFIEEYYRSKIEVNNQLEKR